ncbi:MAG TPA: type II secretion system protein GspG [Phycisphaerales bacterium]|nr:type II secretion system protein GspG [Phycisphaerales bacterium]
MNTQRPRRTEASAFTLLEMMLVVMIMGVLIGIAAWNIIGQGDKARRAATIATMKNVEGMLKTYNLDYGVYPPTIDALVPKYTEKKPVDAWKHPLQYNLNSSGSTHPYELYSLGADNEAGNTDDIDWWHADDPQPNN